MNHFFRPLLRFLFHLGYFGPLVMGVLDSSLLFLPFGNDLLIVALVSRHHDGYLLYVLTAVCGSTLGVFLLDLLARHIGESGVQKVAGPRQFTRLRKKVGEHGAIAIAVACIAPPPFPFTMVVAVNSALAYPRAKLLGIVAATRAARFLILGFLAVKFGRSILHIMNTDAFKWTVEGFAILCITGSVFSMVKWVRGTRNAPQPAPAT